MAPDMFLGFDAARGKDRSSLQIIDMESGKVVAASGNVKIWPVTVNDIKPPEEDVSSLSLNGLHTQWHGEIKLTHKQRRQMKKNLRAMITKKPRLPRKLKKKLRTDWKLYCIVLKEHHSSVWTQAQPIFDFYEAKLAAIGLSYDIPDIEESMNIIQQAFG